MMTRSRVEIDTAAIRHNFMEARRLAGPGVEVFPVVKADAYGHGLIPVSQVLQEAGADGFLVANIDEAVALRDAGIGVPILLHVPDARNESFEIVEYGLSPVVFDLGFVDSLARAANRRGKTVSAYLKVDTGMGRLGLRISDLPDALSYIRGKGCIEVLGLMSHLSCADSSDDYTQAQTQRFHEAVNIARSAGFPMPKNNLANSAGLIAHPATRMNLVRPGIMIYGVYPDRDMDKAVSLKPALSFKTKVVQVSKVPPGTSISYGRRYITSDSSTIAAMPIGYENGYSRLLSNRATVLVRGRRAAVAGTVCMCLTMIDVSHIEGVQVEDEVVVIGRQDDQVISVDEVASWADTISYEVLCAVGTRNPRAMINGSRP